MDYTYGCKENQCEMYVYRITNVNDDGKAIDLSWPMVMKRCNELNINHVPNIIYHGSTPYNCEEGPFVTRGERCRHVLHFIVDTLIQGASTLDAGHLREGVVVRVETADGVTAYKAKSHDFLVLEGIAKDKENYVDMEEVSLSLAIPSNTKKS